MKNSIFVSALLVVMLSAGLGTQASAQCYYRHYGHRVVRYCPPPPPPRVYGPRVVIGTGGGYYGHPRHYAPARRSYGYHHYNNYRHYNHRY